MNKIIPFLRTHKNTLLWCLLIFCSLAIHLVPFLQYGNNPLGYDTGFYRRFLIEHNSGISGNVVPGLGEDAFVPRVFLRATQTLPLSPGIILYGSYILFWLLTTGVLFFIVKKRSGENIAWLSCFLFVFSSVGYYTYWYILWKNIFALFLLLLLFLAIEHKKTAFLFLLGGLIAWSHQTTTIITLLCLGLFWILEKERRREIGLLLLLMGSIFVSLHSSGARSIFVNTPTAVFLEWKEYFFLSLPLFIMIPFGIRPVYKDNKKSIFFCFSLVTIIFVTLGLPFYQRIFVFSDITLSVISATGFVYAFHQKENDAKNLLILFLSLLSIGIIGGNLVRSINDLTPLVSEQTITEINSLETTLPKDSYVLTTSDIAPWVHGFTHFHIIAPGLLYDTHNFEEWTDFWNATSSVAKIDFLNTFPKPLFIYTNTNEDTDAFTAHVPCVKKIDTFLWKNECGK